MYIPLLWNSKRFVFLIFYLPLYYFSASAATLCHLDRVYHFSFSTFIVHIVFEGKSVLMLLWFMFFDVSSLGAHVILCWNKSTHRYRLDLQL